MVSGWDKSPGQNNDYTSKPLTIRDILRIALLVLLVISGAALYNLYG